MLSVPNLIHPVFVVEFYDFCLKPLYKVRVAFSKAVHAARARAGPPGTNHGTFIAKPSGHHVHVTL